MWDAQIPHDTSHFWSQKRVDNVLVNGMTRVAIKYQGLCMPVCTSDFWNAKWGLLVTNIVTSKSSNVRCTIDGPDPLEGS